MSAREEALKIILTKRRTAKQVYEKLLLKEYSEDEAAEAVEYYKEKGYIDEKDFAGRYARDAANIKGRGAARIRCELKMRGISDEDADEALKDIEFDVASLMIKKFPICRDIKEKQKIINHFLRRGFSFGEINDAFKENYSLNEVFE